MLFTNILGIMINEMTNRSRKGEIVGERGKNDGRTQAATAKRSERGDFG